MYSNSSLRQTATTIVFIDASVSDYQTLQTGVVEGVETVILSPNQDGIEQISQILQQHPHITTIHILSHGSPGCLYLGNSQLNLTNIHNYTQLSQHWHRLKNPTLPLMWVQILPGRCLRFLHEKPGKSHDFQEY